MRGSGSGSWLEFGGEWPRVPGDELAARGVAVEEAPRGEALGLLAQLRDQGVHLLRGTARVVGLGCS